MPYVFSEKVEAKDIQLIDSANWQLNVDVLPNGDNAVEKITETGKRTFGVVGTSLSIVGVWNTIEFWIKPKAGWDTARVLLEASTIGRAGRQWRIETNGLTGEIPNIALLNEGRGVAVGANLILDQWNYVAAMFLVTYYGTASANNYVSSYINGSPGPAASDGGVGRLGGAGVDCGIHMVPSNTSVCELSKLAHYTKLITQPEVTERYNTMISA